MQLNVSCVFQAQMTGLEVANDAMPDLSSNPQVMHVWDSVLLVSQITENQGDNVFLMAMQVLSFPQ
jgi:hypothetical protein